MRAFLLDSKMTTLQGVFYPTGYAFIMFPDEAQAQKAAEKLEAAGFDEDDIMLLKPQEILQQIGKVEGDSTVPLPSVGTEGATVRKYVDLAFEGHHALMVKAPSDKDSERMMSVVRDFPFSYGQKYHMLAIEDLE